MRQLDGTTRQGRLTAVPRPGRWHRLAALLAALTLSAGGLLVASSGPAAAANNGLFSVEPTSPPNTPPIQIRPFFSPQLQPGVQAADSVTVINETSTPMTLHLYASDAYTARSGGFAIRPDRFPKRQMGAWIHLPISLLTVPPHAGDLIPFSYTPPANAPPGDHAGGIVAEETKGTLSKHGSVGITVLQAVGSRVYGRVAGPLNPRLSVTGVSINTKSSIATQFGGAVDATVTYSVSNTGNENANPKVKLSLSPLIGAGPKSRTVQLPQVLPGSTVTFSQTFKNVVPYGSLSATVTARALGVQATGTNSAVVIPWGLVGIVIILIALIWWLIHRRRRRRRIQAPPAPAGAPVTTSATPLGQ